MRITNPPDAKASLSELAQARLERLTLVTHDARRSRYALLQPPT